MFKSSITFKILVLRHEYVDYVVHYITLHLMDCFQCWLFFEMLT